MEKLDEMYIIDVQVPKNLTHLLQPLDLTTNLIFKRLEKQSFCEYFTENISRELSRNPNMDVTTIDIDLKLSTMKPRHAKCMTKIYNYLLSPRGREIILSGWKAAGITNTVIEARHGIMPDLDPFN